ncbi:MAG TPA: dienelactone hydrolase family protein, partial [Devosia sp.]|nr:dienelactone hydrolase family protein [Devosia sp.]
RHDIGASELLDGREYLLSPWGPLLAQNGYVAFCLDMPSFGSQSARTESAMAKALIWYGRSLIGRMLEQEMAALSYLSSRADVDPGRIGGFGISLGSTLSYWQAAIDPRLKAIAHLCCFADYATLIELGAHDHHAIYLLVPGLLNAISTGQIAGLVAPRPQLICVGGLDELTPRLSVERGLAEARQMYEQAGAAWALDFFEEPLAHHEETPQMRARVLAHFARHL